MQYNDLINKSVEEKLDKFIQNRFLLKMALAV